MPPKGGQVEESSTPKAKAPATPKKDVTPKKEPTPKKPKEAIVFNVLSHDTGAAIPVDVKYEGSEHSKLGKNGKYQHVIKFEAPSSFTLHKTLVFTEGELAGLQGIIVRPAKAFLFMKVPKEVRLRIYNFYLAPQGVVNGPIVVDGKRTGNKELYAKTYADSSKDRVALLAVCKEIRSEATPILYAHTFKLESTNTLMDFLCLRDRETRALLRSIVIKQWIKTTSRNCMALLSEAPNLNRLRIENGVFNDSDSGKAVKSFHAESYKFLEAVGNAKGKNDAAVDILIFGKKAFTFKDDDKQVKPWSKQLLDEFKDNLRAKLT